MQPIQGRFLEQGVDAGLVFKVAYAVTLRTKAERVF